MGAAVTAKPADPRTYDEIQAGAVRVVCQDCGKAWDMTKPQQPCAECRRKQAKALLTVRLNRGE